MVWYEYLRRDIPYIKDYRGFNLWYDYNNGKHHEMKKVRSFYFEHWLRRLCKHEAFSRTFVWFVMIPFWIYVYKTFKRFRPVSNNEEESLFSGAQFVSVIGRNHYGFESRASKSFEHALGVLLGKEILGHILEQDNDVFRQEEIADEDAGLIGDFTEEDILALRKVPNHLPHVGIVYLRPEKHYLNEKPNDFLSPYKIENEVNPLLQNDNNKVHKEITNQGHHH